MTKPRGFTIIELMIYLGIVTVAMLVFTSFLVDVSTNAARSRITREVQQNGRLIVDRVAQAVRTAQSITSVSAHTLVLIDSTGTTVTITCNNGMDGKVKIGANDLTSTTVRVSDPVCFTASPPGVTVTMTVQQVNVSAIPANQKSFPITTTVIPRSQTYL